jgi:hypothetical protein
MKEYKTDRKVFFVPANDIIVLVPGRKDFTDEEKRSCWYSKLEKEKMRYQCFKDAMRLELLDVKNPSCYRGIEAYTTGGRQSLTSSIYECVDAVMDEQEMQWERREENVDSIAAISQEISIYSINRAIIRAIEDSREARRVCIPRKQGNVSRASEHTPRSVSTEPGCDMKEPVVTREKREMFSMMIERDMISGRGRTRGSKKD